MSDQNNSKSILFESIYQNSTEKLKDACEKKGEDVIFTTPKNDADLVNKIYEHIKNKDQ